MLGRRFSEKLASSGIIAGEKIDGLTTLASELQVGRCAQTKESGLAAFADEVTTEIRPLRK